MSRIIKNNAIVDDSWVRLSNVTAMSELPAGNVIVPLAFWQANRVPLQTRGNVGVCLDSADDARSVHQDLAQLPLIAVNFSVFSDGRGYSTARILRDQYQFQGEIRAVGDVLEDQLFYLRRCGFDAFALRDNDKYEQAIKRLNDFAYTYQAGADDARPLFARRA